MRVLIVSSYKPSQEGNIAPFVKEQAEAIAQQGVECSFYLVRGKGIHGYLRELPSLRKRIREVKPNVVHAHFGLCGLLANLQRKVPVVTTYHGCDIQALGMNLFLSRMSMKLSRFNIFVSERMKAISKFNGNKYSIVPCGINLNNFHQIEKGYAMNSLGWDKHKKNIQFAGSFDSPVKNYSLARQALANIHNCEIKELAGLTREQVNLSLCAADCLLMTSIREGSPMVIKEAMACGCPIVSTDVGDVKHTLENVSGAFVIEGTHPDAFTKAIESALLFSGRTNGRERLIELGLDSVSIARKIVCIYNTVLNERDNRFEY